MKKIQVEITGDTPLLMCSPKKMIKDNMEGDKAKIKTSKKGTLYDPKIEAEGFAYRKSNKELYIPQEAIYGAIINGASWYKINKRSAAQVLAGAIRIDPIEVGLGTKNYKIDSRPVNVGGRKSSKIIRHRPRIEKWKVSFTIIYNDGMIGDASIIKEVLQEAGERVGILSFSPRNRGSFGCFKVTKWKEV